MQIAQFCTTWKHKNQIFVLFLPKKIMGGNETGGMEQNWWALPPGLDLKPPLPVGLLNQTESSSSNNSSTDSGFSCEKS